MAMRSCRLAASAPATPARRIRTVRTARISVGLNRSYSVIPKSGYRFSEEITLQQ